MRKIKGILPTLREKKRYLVFRIISESEIKIDNAMEEIKNKILSFMGLLNFGKAGIMFLKDSKNKGIIKVNTSFLDQLRTSLSLISSINKTPVIISTVGVSGILNKAVKNYA